MAARFRFLSAERGSETIHFSKRHRVCFVIKLPGLCEINLLVVKIIDFEQRRCTLACGGSKNGRIDQRKAVRIEIFAYGPNHFMAYANGRILPPAAQP